MWGVVCDKQHVETNSILTRDVRWMWDLWLVLVHSQAAKFCTSCSWDMRKEHYDSEGMTKIRVWTGNSRSLIKSIDLIFVMFLIWKKNCFTQATCVKLSNKN